MASEALIIDVVRTPRGKAKQGAPLSSVKPVQLLSLLYEALRLRKIPLEEVDDVLLGCVTQVGDQGTNIAKISALYAGLPDTLPGLTLNRFCTSGLDTIALGASQLLSGMGPELLLAGGVESMSRVPIFSDKGCWFSDPEVASQTGFVPMGFAADVVANLRRYSREELDQWAARSHQRAALAQREGRFLRSIIPVEAEDGSTLAHDELVRGDTTAEGLAGFEPLFADARAEALARARYPQLATLTPLHHRGNSPAMADGAALAALASRSLVSRLGLTPRAKILSAASVSVEPVQMLTGSIQAARLALERAGLTLEQLDLVEINEAFAAPTLATLHDLGLDESRVNVNGGTIAMGHAMGATGTMLVATLLDELERQDLTRGLVTLAGGAGVASAMILERV